MRWLFRSSAAAVLVVALVVAVHFPYATDSEPSREEVRRTIAFYNQAYAAPQAGKDEDIYVKTAEEAAKGIRVKEDLQDFIRLHGLQNKKALDVGAGQGYLQDVVDDYTALDISPTAKRFYHKPFVLGSATAMPFPDNQFDVVWSIWVLEHIPNPEQALREMRRVVKNGGMLYLFPAWSAATWAGDGYPARPYSDFPLPGKLVKASIPIRSSLPFLGMYTIPVRLMRLAAYEAAWPTRLRYRRLTPNFERYWMPDSDAVSSIDRYEGQLWFTSRGDECLNCRSAWNSAFDRVRDARLMIRVRKD